MAIKALAWMKFDPPVYCYHEIVHNRLVVDRFRRLGVVFVDDVTEVPEGRPLMLSAHGSAPEVVLEAKRRWVCGGCCLPARNQGSSRGSSSFIEGYQIVYVGHEGHEEAAGTVAVAPDHIHLVEDTTQVDELPEFDAPIAMLAQTTLSHRDWQGVLEATRERFPDVWMPGRSDLCFATTNRQSALSAIAERCDAVIVIGSANSSNTMALAQLAESSGCSHVYRINSADELPSDLQGIVGVTAVPAPEELVEAVIENGRLERVSRNSRSLMRTSTFYPENFANCCPLWRLPYMHYLRCPTTLGWCL